jgi:hypothetical protein
LCGPADVNRTLMAAAPMLASATTRGLTSMVGLPSTWENPDIHTSSKSHSFTFRYKQQLH